MFLWGLVFSFTEKYKGWCKRSQVSKRIFLQFQTGLESISQWGSLSVTFTGGQCLPPQSGAWACTKVGLKNTSKLNGEETVPDSVPHGWTEHPSHQNRVWFTGSQREAETGSPEFVHRQQQCPPTQMAKRKVGFVSLPREGVYSRTAPVYPLLLQFQLRLSWPLRMITWPILPPTHTHTKTLDLKAPCEHNAVCQSSLSSSLNCKKFSLESRDKPQTNKL